jgi:hypothetical protein
MKEEIV